MSVTYLWFSAGFPISSINKTNRLDITEILLRVSLNTITLILPPSATFITNLNPGSTTSAAIRLNFLQQSTWISINCSCILKKNLVGYFGSLTFNNWSSLLLSELFYFNLFSDNNQNRLNKQVNNIHYKNIIFNQLIAITAVEL